MRTVVCLAAALVGALAVVDCGRVAGRAVDAIENDLVADDATVRAHATAELADRFPDGAVAVPMLVDLLDDESPDVVAAAAKSLDSMALDAAPLLTEFCADRANFSGEKRFGRRMQGLLSLVLFNPRDAFDMFDSTPPAPVTSDGCALAAFAPMEYPPHLRWWRLGAVDAFRRSSGDTRKMAAAALAMFGEDAVAERRIAPPADPRRVAAAEALVPLLKSDVAVQAYCGARIARRLRDGGAGVVAALAENLPAAKAIPASWKEEKSRLVPAAAADALAEIGPAAVAAAPWLNAVVSDPSVDADSGVGSDHFFVRCVRALVRIGRESDLRTLLDRNAPNALFLARAAAEGGCSADLVLPRLVAAAERPDASSDAFLGLLALGAAAKSALPLAKARMRAAEDDDQRMARAETVLAIVPDDADAITELDATLNFRDMPARRITEDSFGNARYVLCRRAAPTPTVLRHLAAGVAPGTSMLDLNTAADALGRVGPAARDAVPDLVRHANYEDHGFEGWRIPDHLAALVVALGRIGPDASAAVPLLTKLRDGKDEMFRVVAAQALRRIRAKT
jgi:hypothetical protein